MKVIKHIENLIINNKIKFKLFFHYNQKYTINELITNVFIILKKGMYFREIKKYAHIHWRVSYSICISNRIMKPMDYKFFIKLSKYNILNDMYKDTINMYLNEINKMEINNNNFLYIDSSIVLNKYGIDNISINPQLKNIKVASFQLLQMILVFRLTVIHIKAVLMMLKLQICKLITLFKIIHYYV